MLKKKISSNFHDDFHKEIGKKDRKKYELVSSGRNKKYGRINRYEQLN